MIILIVDNHRPRMAIYNPRAVWAEVGDVKALRIFQFDRSSDK